MTINRVLLLLILIAVQMPGFAQKGSISGKVVDELTSESVPFASVALFTDEHSAPFKGTVTNENGEFILSDLSYRSYNLVISFIGFQADTLKTIEINRQDPDVSIDNIMMAPAFHALDEVEVRAMAKTVRTSIDRKTYRTDDFETARGGTAVDVLNKLPSVSVSPDGIVSVRGTSDFMVYLNGKPTLIDPSM